MLTEVQFYLIKLVTCQKLGNRFSIFTPLTHPINYNAVIPSSSAKSISTRTIAPHMSSIISTIPSLPGVDSEQLHARDLGGGRTLRILTSGQCRLFRF